jgi:hypothetical protein
LMRLPGGARHEHGRRVLVNRRVLAGDADQLADAVRFTEAPHLGRNRPGGLRLLRPASYFETPAVWIRTACVICALGQGRR